MNISKDVKSISHHRTHVYIRKMDFNTDYGYTKAKSLILCGPNSNPNWCGYKGLVFCNNRKHGRRTRCTKMGADGLAENTPNAPELICPICLPKPKNSGFQWKRFHWASVVRGCSKVGKHHLILCTIVCILNRWNEVSSQILNKCLISYFVLGLLCTYSSVLNRRPCTPVLYTVGQ